MRSDGRVVVEVDIDTKSFDKQIEVLEQKLDDLGQAYVDTQNMKPFEGQEEDLKNIAIEMEKVNNKLQEMRKKQDDIDNKGFKNFKDYIDNIGKGVEKTTKKVIKWGLAVFGVRSAYMYIRQAMSTLTQYNEQLATDLEYIRFSLAVPLQGFIENLIQLIFKLMNYINYIANAWFGINLFQNATTKAFEKQNKAMGGTAKSAKELKKTLTGFDEMNILQDNGNVASGGGGGGIGKLAPSIDLSSIQGEVPSWIKWIADNGEQVAIIIGSIGAAILALKLTDFIAKILGVTEGLFKLKTGVALAVGGLVLMVAEIINLVLNYDKMTESEQNVALGLTILGGVIAAVGLALSTTLSFGLSLVITAMAGLVTGYITLIAKQEEEQRVLYDTAKATDNLRTAKENLNSTLGSYTSAVKNAEESAKRLKEAEDNNKLSGEELYNSVLNGTKRYEDMEPPMREVFDAYVMHKEAQARLSEETMKYNKALIAEKDAQSQVRATTFATTGEYDKHFQSLIDGYRKGEIGAKEMTDGVINMMDHMDASTRKTFVEGLPVDVKQAFGVFNKEVMGGRNSIAVLKDGTEVSFKEIANSADETFSQDMPNSLSQSNRSIDTTISKINGIGKALRNLPTTTNIRINTSGSGGSYNAKGAIYYPRLASGGIINQPSRGVPLGTAIGGEHGAEGVIPLTDSQQMELLGEAIGRYITINANIVNTMNGRVIGRELQKINNENSFASNR